MNHFEGMNTLNEINESCDYTVPELAKFWDKESIDIIRMANALSITVTFLLHNVDVNALKKGNEDKTKILEKGLIGLEELRKEYIKNTAAYNLKQFTHPLEKNQLQAMVFDGAVDVSYWYDDDQAMQFKVNGQPAFVMPENCFMSGKDAMHIENKFIKKEAGAKAEESNTPQTAQGLSLPLEHEYESSLLKIAVECWKALYEDAGPDGKKIRKPQIIAWVKEHYPDVSKNSREKIIAPLVNPDSLKKGGASPSE
ncbi:MAG: hypothetical protein WBM35_08635 [Candidatus Electrothrix sp.]